MTIRPATLALPFAALLAGCGGEPTSDITTTNTGNVILNDAQANYSFENDEVANTLAEDMNGAMADNAVMTDGTYGGATDATGNAM